MLRRIYAVEATVIPPGHVMNVPVTMALSSLRPTSNNWAMEPRSLGTGILDARILMRDKGHRSAVRVMNVGESDFVLRHRKFNGEAERVTTLENKEASFRPPDRGKVFFRKRRPLLPEDLSRNRL